MDFDDEARALWTRLNLDPSSQQQGHWNSVDPIWRHPQGGGTIYVGNQTAAESMTILRQNGITHVVNCTFGDSKIPDYHQGKLQYYNFAISHWQRFVNATNASVIAFAAPMFAFVTKALLSGESVLVSVLSNIPLKLAFQAYIP